MRFVSSDEIARCLDLLTAIKALRESLLHNDKDEASCPPRTLIRRDSPPGVFGTMPGYFPRHDLFVVKVAAFVPRAVATNGGSVNAAILVLDGRNGEPVAVIDGAALTRLKCAAVSAHVTDACAIDGPITLGIIGCGAQAREQLRAVRAVRVLRELRIYSRTRTAAEAWARELLATSSQDFRIVVTDSVEQICERADVIATATTSTQPLFCEERVSLQPHVHINCMGAHTEHSRELGLALLRSSTLVVEDRETAVREAGDVHADALELKYLQGNQVHLRHERTIFSSTGHISVDACVAASLLERLSPTAADERRTEFTN